jgi:hypothetical protein
VKRWNRRYNRDGWRLRWRVGDVLYSQAAVSSLYEDAYYHLLAADGGSLAQQVVQTARDVYDHAEDDVVSDLDYGIQQAVSTHLQDIAVRRVLVRLGLWFRGKHLLRLRKPDDDPTGDSLGALLDSGRVPFHCPDLVTRPLLEGWWNPLSVECCYQFNKILQHRER